MGYGDLVDGIKKFYAVFFLCEQLVLSDKWFRIIMSLKLRCS